MRFPSVSLNLSLSYTKRSKEEELKDIFTTSWQSSMKSPAAHHIGLWEVVKKSNYGSRRRSCNVFYTGKYCCYCENVKVHGPTVRLGLLFMGLLFVSTGPCGRHNITKCGRHSFHCSGVYPGTQGIFLPLEKWPNRAAWPHHNRIHITRGTNVPAVSLAYWLECRASVLLHNGPFRQTLPILAHGFSSLPRHILDKFCSLGYMYIWPTSVYRKLLIRHALDEKVGSVASYRTRKEKKKRQWYGKNRLLSETNGIWGPRGKCIQWTRGNFCHG